MAVGEIPASGKRGVKTPEVPPPSSRRRARGKAEAYAAPAKERVAPRRGAEAAAGRSPKLTELAFCKILDAIVHGRLDLGEPLSENDLARALCLSKAPIRESLCELQSHGLVVVVPQSGTYVFSPTSAQIAELCDYRALLETSALRSSMLHDPKGLLGALRQTVRQMSVAHREGNVLIGKQKDTEFHMAILRHSGNRYLIQSYQRISYTIEALRYRFIDTAIYRSKGYDEHRRMVELLAENQVSRAVALLQDHIRRIKRMQSSTTWGVGRLRRRDYKFRDYAEILA